ncbi:MAG: glycosyltransferase, partial [Tannerellaceae bacterium]|nr:glycosyltransferase [Tannerellaceae bacterium]
PPPRRAPQTRPPPHPPPQYPPPPPGAGVHTARNIGTKEGRGEFLLFLDSDDEIFPETLKRFIELWEEIPCEKRQEFRNVVASCEDQNGKRCGIRFPDNINAVSWKKAQRLCRKTKGEHFGFNRMDIMKNNLWPEPQGITFVTEGVLWGKLDKQYKSYFANDILRIYHRETEESYTNIAKKGRDLQSIKNDRWSSVYMLNNRDVRGAGKYLKRLIKVVMYSHVMKWKNTDDIGIVLERTVDKLFYAVFYIPLIPVAVYFIKKRVIDL